MRFADGSGEHDIRPEVLPPAKPCCKRLDKSWCVLADGHAGRCLGYATELPKPMPPEHQRCQCSACTTEKRP